MAVSTFHDASDPFVLADKALQRLLQILAAHRQRPLLRRWIDHPYGEEEIALLEEEVIPALLRLRERVDEIDAELQHAYNRGYDDRQLDIEERQVPGPAAAGLFLSNPGSRRQLLRCGLLQSGCGRQG